MNLKLNIMKSLIAIILIGVLSFSSNNNETSNIVLEEYEINMVNLDYELELEAVDLNLTNDFYLQNQVCYATGNNEVNKLTIIELQIPNYKYLEELDSIEFGI